MRGVCFVRGGPPRILDPGLSGPGGGAQRPPDLTGRPVQTPVLGVRGHPRTPPNTPGQAELCLWPYLPKPFLYGFTFHCILLFLKQISTRAVSGPSALLGPEMVKFASNFCYCAVDQEKAGSFLAHLPFWGPKWSNLLRISAIAR